MRSNEIWRDPIRFDQSSGLILTLVEAFRNFASEKRVIGANDNQQNRVDEDEQKSEVYTWGADELIIVSSGVVVDGLWILEGDPEQVDDKLDADQTAADDQLRFRAQEVQFFRRFLAGVEDTRDSVRFGEQSRVHDREADADEETLESAAGHRRAQR